MPLSASANKATPTVTVTATPNPASAGQTVSIVASVSGSDGTPTGSVTFYASGVTLATQTLSSGKATLTAPSNGYAPGSYTITAVYGGSSTYASGTSSGYSFVLSKAPTSTTLASAPSPVTPPNAVTLTATVKRSASGAAGTPGGSVRFYYGSTLLGSANVNSSGVATFSQATGGVPAGNYGVTAAYAGDTSDSASTSPAVTVDVTAPYAGYAYTINSVLNTTENGNISAYGETGSNGELNLLPSSPIETNLYNPVATVADGPMNLLFVAGAASGSQSTGIINAFTINPASGALTAGAVTTPTYPPMAMAVSANGKFLYVSHHSQGTISAYSVGSNGSLSEISGSPFTLPAVNCGLFCQAPADEMFFDSVNKQLYVVSEYAWVVATFTADPNTGTLTWVYNEPTGSGPYYVAADPAGKYAFVSNTPGKSVSAYTITPNATANGEPEPLTPVSGSPFAAGGSPAGVIVDGTGNFVYVANSGDNTISAYRIGSGGVLTQITGSPFTITGGSTSPGQIVTDVSGAYLYVISGSYDGGSRGAVTAYSINQSTGAITQLSTSPYSPGTNANGPAQITTYKP